MGNASVTGLYSPLYIVLGAHASWFAHKRGVFCHMGLSSAKAGNVPSKQGPIGLPHDSQHPYCHTQPGDVNAHQAVSRQQRNPSFTA